MSKVRPLSLTIIAWLFIIVGMLSAWDVISGLWQHQLSLNLGVLFIFLGYGLLKLRPAAHSWALAMVVLGWILLAVAIICCFFGSGTVRIGHQEMTGGYRFLVLVCLGLIDGTVLTWMTRVLTRRDVEELFQNDAA
jgi:hypothetical protein